MLQVEVIDCDTAYQLQKNMNEALKELQNNGHEIKNILYAIYPETKYAAPSYSTMILYEEK